MSKKVGAAVVRALLTAALGILESDDVSDGWGECEKDGRCDQLGKDSSLRCAPCKSYGLLEYACSVIRELRNAL